MKKQVKGFTKKTTSLDNLPMRERMCHHKWRHNWYGHLVNNYSAWRTARRIISRSIGKSFDEIYSKFCKEFPYQEFKQSFKEHFNELETMKQILYYQRWGRGSGSYYFVDEEGLIKIHNYGTPQKKTYTFKSHDYKREWVHKVTGKIYEYRSYWDFSGQLPKGYEDKVIQGFEITLESKNDPHYKRLRHEDDIARKARYKKQKLERSNKAYSFLTASEKKKIDDRELDLINRDRHGFGEYSFKGNPYHGRQNKSA